MTSFAKSAIYYDHLYRDKNYLKEASFIIKILNKNPPPGQHILELGCGTGIHASILGKKKWIVDGLDLSEQMLCAANERKKRLKKEVSDRLHFFNGDVRNFQIKKKYDAIISLFHVVSYQSSNEDVLNMFKNVKKHLKPGGIFIFDYWFGPAVLSNKPEVRIKRIESSDLLITRLAEPSINPNSSLVDVNYEIQIRDHKSGQIETLHELHTMRYFFQNEIQLFLKQSNLKFIESKEWLTGNSPGWNSWSVYTVCSC